MAVLGACGSKKAARAPETTAYIEAVRGVLDAGGKLAADLAVAMKSRGGGGMGDCPQVKSAVALEAALQKLEKLKAAPAQLPNCFAAASAYPDAVRKSVELWVNDPSMKGDNFKAGVTVCMELSDPGVMPKLSRALCSNSTPIEVNCTKELAELDGEVPALASACR